MVRFTSNIQVRQLEACERDSNSTSAALSRRGRQVGAPDLRTPANTALRCMGRAVVSYAGAAVCCGWPSDSVLQSMRGASSCAVWLVCCSAAAACSSGTKICKSSATSLCALLRVPVVLPPSLPAAAANRPSARRLRRRFRAFAKRGASPPSPLGELPLGSVALLAVSSSSSSSLPLSLPDFVAGCLRCRRSPFSAFWHQVETQVSQATKPGVPCIRPRPASEPE